MTEKPFLPKSQNITWKDLLAALVGAGYVIGAVIILEFYSRLWGGLMIGVVVVFAKGYWLLWERRHKQEMVQAKKGFNESGLGKLYNYGLNIFIAGAVLYILYRLIVS